MHFPFAEDAAAFLLVVFQGCLRGMDTSHMNKSTVSINTASKTDSQNEALNPHRTRVQEAKRRDKTRNHENKRAFAQCLTCGCCILSQQQ